MLSVSEKIWAQSWSVTPEKIKIFRDELQKAHDNGTYSVYGTAIKMMDEDEIKVAYMNMRNYIADTSTHHNS